MLFKRRTICRVFIFLMDASVLCICDKKENQCYTEFAQKSGKRFSYEIYYNSRNQIKTACSRICNKT